MKKNSTIYKSITTPYSLTIIDFEVNTVKRKTHFGFSSLYHISFGLAKASPFFPPNHPSIYFLGIKDGLPTSRLKDGNIFVIVR
jgi:hypothetical protein